MEAPGVEALDDGTLQHCFAFLSQRERHGMLSLVCRRWRQVLHSPQLLQSLRLGQLGLEAGPDALLSFCGWLQHHAAPHVVQLEIFAGLAEGGQAGVPQLQDGGYEVPGGQRGVLHARGGVSEALCAALRACGRGRLARLRLSLDSQFRLLPRELACLAGLRALHVEAYLHAAPEAQEPGEPPQRDFALAAAGLAALTALTDLRLAGDVVRLEGGLPPALARLYLDGFTDLTPSGAPLHWLLRQLGSLSALRSLALSRVYSASPDDYRLLSQLTALERLSLNSCSHLPAPLSRLTRLRVLRLEDTPNGWYGLPQLAALGAALRPLRQLSHLVLRNMDCLKQGLPAELGGLPALRRLLFLQRHEAAGGGAPLPAGPWLGGLRQAVLSSSHAAANLPLLSAATALEALVVVDTLGSDSARSRYERHPAIAAWANAHPSLRTLGICDSELPWLAEKARAWEQLRARVAHLGIRPSLSIESGTALLTQLGFTALDSNDITF